MGKYGKEEAQKKLDQLLAEMQDEITGPISSGETTARVVLPTQIVPFPDGFPDNEETWHRAKSDVSIKYAVHHGVVHDKCCPQVQKIPAHMLEFLKEYPSNGVQCSNCEIKAHIRNGAEDIGNYEKYVEFFHRVKWKSSNIRYLYIEHNVRTRIDTDVITVWYKDDVWKIKSHPGTVGVDLFHNNYTAQGTDRFFTSGFHIQKSCVNMSYAVSVLLNYDFNSHFQETAPAEDTLVYTTETPVQEKPVIEQQPELVKKYNRHERIRLKDRIRRFLMQYLGLERRLRIDGLVSSGLAGKPAAGDVCLILWNSDDGKEHWIIAAYSPKKECYTANLGGIQIKIAEEKVTYRKILDLESYGVKASTEATGIQIIT